MRNHRAAAHIAPWDTDSDVPNIGAALPLYNAGMSRRHIPLSSHMLPFPRHRASNDRVLARCITKSMRGLGSSEGDNCDGDYIVSVIISYRIDCHLL